MSVAGYLGKAAVELPVLAGKLSVEEIQAIAAARGRLGKLPPDVVIDAIDISYSGTLLEDLFGPG